MEAGRFGRCSKLPETSSERHEKRILIMSENLEYKDVGGDKPYALSEFHLVDLKNNETHLSYLPPLLNCTLCGVMTASDHVLYLMGGLISSVREDSHFQHLISNSPRSEVEFYLGASYFDLGQQSNGGVWAPLPPTIKPSPLPQCVTLFGKMYAFGSFILTPEVFDPAVGHWKELCVAPPEVENSSSAMPVLADPSNNCILVPFTHPKPTLYAFTPPTGADETHSGGGTWQCLASHFPHWSPVAAVVDGVLFLYRHSFTSPRLRGFDIARRKWLKVCWDKSFGSGVNIKEEAIEVDALLALSDNILCLAEWSPNYDLDNSWKQVHVMFAKYTVERIGNSVNLIPLSISTHLLPDTLEVVEFLPV